MADGKFVALLDLEIGGNARNKRQCGEPIEKGSLRVAIEREIDTGAMVTRGAAYMHPKCVVANLGSVGGSAEDLVAGIKQNSRIPQDELDAVVAQIR